MIPGVDNEQGATLPFLMHYNKNALISRKGNTKRVLQNTGLSLPSIPLTPQLGLYEKPDSAIVYHAVEKHSPYRELTNNAKSVNILRCGLKKG